MCDVKTVIDIIITVVSAICAFITVKSLLLSKGILSKIKLLRKITLLERSCDSLRNMLKECGQLNVLLNPAMNAKGKNTVKEIGDICGNLKSEILELQASAMGEASREIPTMVKLTSMLSEVIAGTRTLSSTNIHMVEQCVNPILRYYLTECDSNKDCLSE